MDIVTEGSGYRMKMMPLNAVWNLHVLRGRLGYY
jgi:hypothetical protein